MKVAMNVAMNVATKLNMRDDRKLKASQKHTALQNMMHIDNIDTPKVE